MSVFDQPVNRLPIQLLRFLGLSGPDSPSRLLDPIQGVVHLLPWWLYAAEQHLESTINPGVGFTGYLSTSALTVPVGQRWIVSAFTLTTAGAIPAASSYRVAGGYNLVLPSVVFALGPSQSAAATEGISLDCFNGRGRDSWLMVGPGDSLGAHFLVNTGAAPAPLLVHIRFFVFSV